MISVRHLLDRKSTRLNSSHANISPLSLHDALPISHRRLPIHIPFSTAPKLHHRHLPPYPPALSWRIKDGNRRPHRSPTSTVRASPAHIPLYRRAYDKCSSPFRSEEHTSELQSRQYLPSFPTRRSSDLAQTSTDPYSVFNSSKAPS